MINFALMTDTPGRVATFLQSRGIIEQVTVGDGSTHWVGVLPGMEWIEVPNPIQTGVDGDGNPIMDTRHVYLVKFAGESESQKAQGFRDWLQANTTVVSPPAGWTIRGEPLGDARKVNGQNVWLAHVDPDRFGVWQ